MKRFGKIALALSRALSHRQAEHELTVRVVPETLREENAIAYATEVAEEEIWAGFDAMSRNKVLPPWACDHALNEIVGAHILPIKGRGSRPSPRGGRRSQFCPNLEQPSRGSTRRGALDINIRKRE